jgi:predicted transcriptional regulator
MHNVSMRTTIEIKPEHRAKLLELAARRGEKGFSSVIAEALDRYLASAEQQQELRKRALKMRGVLSKVEGERLRQRVKALRKLWRSL